MSDEHVYTFWQTLTNNEVSGLYFHRHEFRNEWQRFMFRCNSSVRFLAYEYFWLSEINLLRSKRSLIVSGDILSIRVELSIWSIAWTLDCLESRELDDAWVESKISSWKIGCILYKLRDGSSCSSFFFFPSHTRLQLPVRVTALMNHQSTSWNDSFGSTSVRQRELDIL